MFEFHGWVVIRVNDDDDADTWILEERREKAIAQLKQAITQVHDNFSFLEITKTGNGQIVLLAHGLRNHRYQPIIELFQWISVHLPEESYGLLYVHDDEDHLRGFENCFRVWRLALGKLSEEDDPFFSPYIPTVEKPWQG